MSSSRHQAPEPEDEQQQQERRELLAEFERKLALGQLQDERFLSEDAEHRRQQAIIYSGSLTLLGTGLLLYGGISVVRWALGLGAWALFVALWWALRMARCPRCKKLPWRAGALVHQRSLGWPKGCAHCGLPFAPVDEPEAKN